MTLIFSDIGLLSSSIGYPGHMTVSAMIYYLADLQAVRVLINSAGRAKLTTICARPRAHEIRADRLTDIAPLDATLTMPAATRLVCFSWTSDTDH
jgi:hypothetical protein